jgi:hypothetical protein
MTYLNVRHTVADYEKWRPFFDADEARRRKAGATGVNQIYRDVNEPNTITLVMEWDSAEKAHQFAEDPALGEVMQKAGVVGAPALVAIVTPA